jgi:integrase
VLVFEKYCENWFVYDKCQYIQNKLLHGFTYSKSNAANQRGQLVKHAIPFFTGKLLDEIRADDIEAYIAHLKNNGLSNLSVNHNLKILKVIFKWAKNHGDIFYDPMQEVILLKNSASEKGIFTKEEINELVLRNESFATVWASDSLMYLLNITAYKTGMRLGELQALRKIDIRDGYLHLEHSMDRKYGLKSTKTGKTRDVPIDGDLQKRLLDLCAYTCGEFVFGKECGRRPIRHDEVYHAFHAACEQIGLSKETLKERRISFHSFRHGLVSRLIAGNVSIDKVSAITGHSTRQMVEHYTHLSIDDLREAVNV